MYRRAVLLLFKLAFGAGGVRCIVQLICRSQVLYNLNPSGEEYNLRFCLVSALFWMFSAKQLWSRVMINSNSY